MLFYNEQSYDAIYAPGKRDIVPCSRLPMNYLEYLKEQLAMGCHPNRSCLESDMNAVVLGEKLSVLYKNALDQNSHTLGEIQAKHGLLKYCEIAKNERFGRIEFAIGCNVIQAFKIAVAQVPDFERQPSG